MLSQSKDASRPWDSAGTKVKALSSSDMGSPPEVVLENNTKMTAKRGVVVATDQPAAARLLGKHLDASPSRQGKGRGTCNIHFRYVCGDYHALPIPYPYTAHASIPIPIPYPHTTHTLPIPYRQRAAPVLSAFTSTLQKEAPNRVADPLQVERHQADPGCWVC